MQQDKTASRNGFTLIEMMIVVAIIGILASVAVPSYLESVRRSDRAGAAATMLQAANWMEQQFTVNNSYKLPDGSVPTLPSNFMQSPSSGTAKYNITLAAGTTTTTYSLLATKVGAADKCGNFTLDQSGKRAVSATTDTTVTADCWGGR